MDFMKPLWLNNNDVAAVITHAEATAAVRNALEHHARGQFEQPQKPYIRPGGRENEQWRGRFIYMPAYLGGDFEAAGVKIIAGFPGNPDRGLPRASGIYVLSSTTTGFPLAIMECGELSARRTAAVASVSFLTLAGPGPHAVGVLGAGPIATAVVDAFAENRDIQNFYIYDPHRERAAILAGRQKANVPPVIITSSIAECMAHSSVAVLATTGAYGYLTPELVQKKRLIIALSLDDATPELFLSAAKVVVDDFGDCCREEKLLHRLVQDGRFSQADVHAELGEILIGKKPGRERTDECVYANLMGLGVEDLAVAVRVYENALHLGRGQRLS